MVSPCGLSDVSNRLASCLLNYFVVLKVLHNVSYVFITVQAMIIPDKFQHILRVLNTNIDGHQKIMFGLTAIKVCCMSVYTVLTTLLTDV